MPIYQTLTDSQKLYDLASWFDVYDAHRGAVGGTEVQDFLRDLARRLERQE